MTSNDAMVRVLEDDRVIVERARLGDMLRFRGLGTNARHRVRRELQTEGRVYLTDDVDPHPYSVEVVK